jgi:alpha-beta hydrolase superfamily lysophospholipase
MKEEGDVDSMNKSILALLLCSLAACAPKSQKFSFEKGGAHMYEDHFLTHDNIKLPCKVWRPEQGIDAIIIAVHGFNDYSNSFKQLGEELQKHGVMVIAYDQRGYGSTPNRGIWPGNKNMRNDLKLVTEQVKNKYPDTPLYWLGESMGGAVSMTANQHFPESPIAGTILIAPAVWGWQTMNFIYAWGLRLGAHTIPWMRFTGEGAKVTPSNNIKMLEALGADPLVLKSSRVDSLYGLVSLMDEAHDAAYHLKKPALFLYGANDQLVPKDATRKTMARLPRSPDGNWQVVYYKDGYHMLLRDLEGGKIIRDIVHWIQKKPLHSLEHDPDNVVTFSSSLEGDIPSLKLD